MYRNIGKQIKVVAIVLFILFSVGCLVAGIVLIVDAYRPSRVLPYALPIMIAGPVLMWVGSLFVYGFGELICKATEISRNTAGGACGVPGAAQPTVSDTQPQQPQTPAHSAEYMQRLAKLQSLCSQGIITDEEYDIALNKLRAEEMK